jgi:uridine kinase
MNPDMPCKLIALVGGSGAGKSWLADRLRREFGDDAASLSLDDFYSDPSQLAFPERQRLNFDHPDAIEWPLFESVLRTLQCRQTASVPRYDFTLHSRGPGQESLQPRPYIFVEGLWLLHHARIRALFDLRVFLACAETLRWERRLKRDVHERGRTTESITQQFWNEVAPLNDRFVEPQKSQADLVIEQPITEADISCLIARIRSLRAPHNQMCGWRPSPSDTTIPIPVS